MIEVEVGEASGPYRFASSNDDLSQAHIDPDDWDKWPDKSFPIFRLIASKALDRRRVRRIILDRKFEFAARLLSPPLHREHAPKIEMSIGKVRLNAKASLQCDVA